MSEKETVKDSGKKVIISPTGALGIMAGLTKKFGNVVRVGSQEYTDTPRLPTGIFPLDLASGGGLPMGKITIIYGPESSNKTNTVYKTFEQAQIKYPNKFCVLVDIESAFEKTWAEQMGVDTSRLIVITPEYAEQAADMIESLIYGDDVSVIAVDSVAALVTNNAVESSMDKAVVGGASLVVGRLVNKITVAFNAIRNQGVTPPALILINQIRTKIGQMFGNPETMPGGAAQRYAATLIMRVYGKNVMDKALSSTMPAIKETTIVINKWKVPIFNTATEYKMHMIPTPGIPTGYVPDWNTISAYLKQFDYLGKPKPNGPWVMFGQEYKTLQEAQAFLYGNPKMLQDARAQIISEAMRGGGISEGQDYVETGDK